MDKTKEGHFVAGDIVRPHLLTTAIGQASIAAQSIQSYFDNKSQDSIDKSKNLSPLKKEGLRNYKLGDYENAIDSLTKYLN